MRGLGGGGRRGFQGKPKGLEKGLRGLGKKGFRKKGGGAWGLSFKGKLEGGTTGIPLNPPPPQQKRRRC